MKTVIFDIDGTLSLVGDRVKCLAGGNWDEFYKRCGEDLPNHPAIRTYQALHATGMGPEMVLLTGRRESVRPQTEEWLRKNGVFGYKHLLMRPDGDKRHDTIVKPEMLQLIGIRPDLVFEDRNSMVEYWRGAGVPCFQVAKGDF
jgi:hypothetical protein